MLLVLEKTWTRLEKVAMKGTLELLEMKTIPSKVLVLLLWKLTPMNNYDITYKFQRLKSIISQKQFNEIFWSNSMTNDDRPTASPSLHLVDYSSTTIAGNVHRA
jgi:hypothetical protein